MRAFLFAPLVGEFPTSASSLNKPFDSRVNVVFNPSMPTEQGEGEAEMGQQVITEGNRAVVITVQGASVWANVYVNARNGIDSADITATRWTGKTLKAAQKWAAKQLAV